MPSSGWRANRPFGAHPPLPLARRDRPSKRTVTAARMIHPIGHRWASVAWIHRILATLGIRAFAGVIARPSRASDGVSPAGSVYSCDTNSRQDAHHGFAVPTHLRQPSRARSVRLDVLLFGRSASTSTTSSPTSRAPAWSSASTPTSCCSSSRVCGLHDEADRRPPGRAPSRSSASQPTAATPSTPEPHDGPLAQPLWAGGIEGLLAQPLWTWARRGGLTDRSQRAETEPTVSRA